MEVNTLYQELKKIPKKKAAMTQIKEVTGFSLTWIWKVLKGKEQNEVITKCAKALVDDYNNSLKEIEFLNKNNNNGETLQHQGGPIRKRSKRTSGE